jgi:ABC-type branched-subunit amino acid transport system ATPase component
LILVLDEGKGLSTAQQQYDTTSTINEHISDFIVLVEIRGRNTDFLLNILRGVVLMVTEKNKHLYIVAGPNGSGKTTFARRFLPYYADCINFVNADLIAAGLSPFLPDIAAIKAGKIMLDQILSSLQTVARFMDAIR